jgi:hypothetical protein
MPNGSLGTGASKGNAARKQPDLGVDASLNGLALFDQKSDWNKSIDKAPVDPDSDKIIEKIGKDQPLVLGFGASGKDGKPFGIPYTVVSGDAPRAAITFTYKDADPGPYPFPLMMPIEPGAGGHAIVVDRDGLKAYEASGVTADGPGFKATSGAVWDLRDSTLRKAGEMSADASGLPVLPGLIRYDEVNDQREIAHALRFTAATLAKGYVAPATRSVGTKVEQYLPPAGMRVRLKKSFDDSKYPTLDKVILKAMKKYGMILADAGTNWGVSGTPDMHWNDKDLASLAQLKGSDFEVVKIGTVQGLKDEPAKTDASKATKPQS